MSLVRAQVEELESCPSGLRSSTGNAVWGQPHLGFKSLTLRLIILIMKESADYNAYRFGGFKVTSVTVLRLISELEGSYQLLKYMGFGDDMEVISEMKGRYYKKYYQLVKEEKLC